jgi:CTP:molybdopterin cytidylyltransferase MocA
MLSETAFYLKLCGLGGSVRNYKNMKIVYNITFVKNNFLDIINNIQDDIIITKNYIPVAKIKKNKSSPNSKKKISLIVLGSKKCDNKTTIKSIKTYNRLYSYFNNIVFVYSAATEPYINKFKNKNLIISFNEKTAHPIITALKKGVSGLIDNEDYFMITFLNKNITENRFKKILNAIDKPNPNKNIFIPQFKNEATHPIVFSNKYIEKIIKTRKELGIPYILNKYKNDIYFVNIK